MPKLVRRFKLWWCGHQSRRWGSPWVWIKWRVAEWLYRRHPEWCWADMCSWPLGFDSFGGAYGDARCKREAAEVGCCYCGKHRKEAKCSS